MNVAAQGCSVENLVFSSWKERKHKAEPHNYIEFFLITDTGNEVLAISAEDHGNSHYQYQSTGAFTQYGALNSKNRADTISWLEMVIKESQLKVDSQLAAEVAHAGEPTPDNPRGIYYTQHKVERNVKSDGTHTQRFFLLDQFGSWHLAVVGEERETRDGHYLYKATEAFASRYPLHCHSQKDVIHWLEQRITHNFQQQAPLPLAAGRRSTTPGGSMEAANATGASEARRGGGGAMSCQTSGTSMPGLSGGNGGVVDSGSGAGGCAPASAGGLSIKMLIPPPASPALHGHHHHGAHGHHAQAPEPSPEPGQDSGRRTPGSQQQPGLPSLEPVGFGALSPAGGDGTQGVSAGLLLPPGTLQQEPGQQQIQLQLQQPQQQYQQLRPEEALAALQMLQPPPPQSERPPTAGSPAQNPFQMDFQFQSPQQLQGQGTGQQSLLAAPSPQGGSGSSGSQMLQAPFQPQPQGHGGGLLQFPNQMPQLQSFPGAALEMPLQQQAQQFAQQQQFSPQQPQQFQQVQSFPTQQPQQQQLDLRGLSGGGYGFEQPQLQPQHQQALAPPAPLDITSSTTGFGALPSIPCSDATQSWTSGAFGIPPLQHDSQHPGTAGRGAGQGMLGSGAADAYGQSGQGALHAAAGTQDQELRSALGTPVGFGAPFLNFPGSFSASGSAPGAGGEPAMTSLLPRGLELNGGSWQPDMSVYGTNTGGGPFSPQGFQSQGMYGLQPPQNQQQLPGAFGSMGGAAGLDSTGAGPLNMTGGASIDGPFGGPGGLMPGVGLGGFTPDPSGQMLPQPFASAGPQGAPLAARHKETGPGGVHAGGRGGGGGRGSGNKHKLAGVAEVAHKRKLARIAAAGEEAVRAAQWAYLASLRNAALSEAAQQEALRKTIASWVRGQISEDETSVSGWLDNLGQMLQDADTSRTVTVPYMSKEQLQQLTYPAAEAISLNAALSMPGSTALLTALTQQQEAPGQPLALTAAGTTAPPAAGDGPAAPIPELGDPSTAAVAAPEAAPAQAQAPPPAPALEPSSQPAPPQPQAPPPEPALPYQAEQLAAVSSLKALLMEDLEGALSGGFMALAGASTVTAPAPGPGPTSAGPSAAAPTAAGATDMEVDAAPVPTSVLRLESVTLSPPVAGGNGVSAQHSSGPSVGGRMLQVPANLPANSHDAQRFGSQDTLGTGPSGGTQEALPACSSQQPGLGLGASGTGDPARPGTAPLPPSLPGDAAGAGPPGSQTQGMPAVLAAASEPQQQPQQPPTGPVVAAPPSGQLPIRPSGPVGSTATLACAGTAQSWSFADPHLARHGVRAALESLREVAALCPPVQHMATSKVVDMVKQYTTHPHPAVSRLASDILKRWRGALIHRLRCMSDARCYQDPVAALEAKIQANEIVFPAWCEPSGAPRANNAQAEPPTPLPLPGTSSGAALLPGGMLLPQPPTPASATAGTPGGFTPTAPAALQPHLPVAMPMTSPLSATPLTPGTATGAAPTPTPNVAGAGGPFRLPLPAAAPSVTTTPTAATPTVGTAAATARAPDSATAAPSVSLSLATGTPPASLAGAGSTSVGLPAARIRGPVVATSTADTSPVLFDATAATIAQATNSVPTPQLFSRHASLTGAQRPPLPQPAVPGFSPSPPLLSPMPQAQPPAPALPLDDKAPAEASALPLNVDVPAAAATPAARVQLGAAAAAPAQAQPEPPSVSMVGSAPAGLQQPVSTPPAEGVLFASATAEAEAEAPTPTSELSRIPPSQAAQPQPGLQAPTSADSLVSAAPQLGPRSFSSAFLPEPLASVAAVLAASARGLAAHTRSDGSAAASGDGGNGQLALRSLAQLQQLKALAASALSFCRASRKTSNATTTTTTSTTAAAGAAGDASGAPAEAEAEAAQASSDRAAAAALSDMLLQCQQLQRDLQWDIGPAVPPGGSDFPQRPPAVAPGAKAPGTHATAPEAAATAAAETAASPRLGDLPAGSVLDWSGLSTGALALPLQIAPLQLQPEGRGGAGLGGQSPALLLPPSGPLTSPALETAMTAVTQTFPVPSPL